MPRSVFVSYSQPDRDRAFELVARLEACGISVWIAPRDVSPAADWAEEIIEAISGARLMILVFSAHSNASPQVRREVERAVHKRVPVLPFRIADVIPSKSLEYFLSSQHWMDAFPPPLEPYYHKLCAHVVAMLERTSAAVAMAAAPLPATAATAAGVTPAFRPEQLQALERLLAHHIGPVAQHLVRHAAAKLPSWDQLVTRLAEEIDSTPARKQFLDACHALGRQNP
jgi:TIR domain